MNVRVRFAPSPTGYLHIGGLRTALYDYLFAKQNGGKFILRIEDTDRERFVDGAIESLITVFSDLGLDFDEGPILINGKIEQKGDKGPYIQSERLSIYSEQIKTLIQNGNAYHCFCTPEELEKQREEQLAQKLQPKYSGKCRNLTTHDVQKKLNEGMPHVIRMRIPEGETTFKDLVRGSITIAHSELDDQVLIKSDGFPTYHFAVVVDDHFMEISHVLRAEEWIPSTPKHILLYQMFGWEIPEFAHLPQLLNPDRSKLSKRQGDVAAEDYLKKGYLKEALLNFLALLGYNPKGDQEIYSMSEMIDLFDITKVNSSGAVVNFEKLDWMNQTYIKEKSKKELAELCRPFLQEEGIVVDQEILERITEVEKTRLTVLKDIVSAVDVYLHQSSYDPELLVWKKADREDAKKCLSEVQSVIEGVNDANYTQEGLETAIKGFIEATGRQNGNVLWPLRVALSGKQNSAGPFELAWALGKEESLQRIKIALNKLS